MKLLVGDKNHIDFSSPIEMTDQQRKDFVEFMKTLYEPSIVQETGLDLFREKRLGDMKVYPMFWTDEEQEYMLTSYKSTEQISEALGRSWMAVDMRYGLLVSQFSEWKTKNNKILASDNYKELVKEFLIELKTPKEVIELANKIKQIHQWFFNIKSDTETLFEKLNPKPSEKVFKQAIKLLKTSDEFKARYAEYFYV